MTPKQAQTKANTLWGKGKEFLSGGGCIQKRPARKYDGHGTDPANWPEFMYDVGHIASVCGISMFSVKGSGTSWEAAFEAAEQARLRDKQRFDEAKTRVVARKATA